jgi:vitamin B12 transporter
VRAAFTHQRPRDEDTGKLLRSRAESFGSISLAKTWGAWQVSTTVAGNGARFDSGDEAAASRMGGYGVLNAQVRYALDKRWSIELSGSNLADRKYELAQGYNTPGRLLLLNVRFEAK